MLTIKKRNVWRERERGVRGSSTSERGEGGREGGREEDGRDEDGREGGLTMLQSVGSSPGRPRCERFVTNFQGEKGSLATTCPVKLGREESNRRGGGGEKEG